RFGRRTRSVEGTSPRGVFCRPPVRSRKARPVSPPKLLFVFPGQGSQYAGMGSDLVEDFAAAREVFERASDVVEYDMLELCFRDPRDELKLTRFTQPALLTHQLACLAALRAAAGDVRPAL